jgi:ubiquinone/menaquinone biosynthesis C-methylase UbiE
MKAPGWGRVVLGGVGGLLFFWTVVMKLVSRLAARYGLSSACPASVAWLVDNPFRRRYMEPVLGWAGIQPGETVLELGPGPGVFTVPAAQRLGPGGQLVAVDIQPKMIAQTAMRVRSAQLQNVASCVGSAHDLPLAPESIDRALLVSVLPEIPQPSRALAELHHVLRQDGILSITAEFLDPDYWFVGETVREMEKAGFTLLAYFGNTWRYTANFRKTERPGRTAGGSRYR